MPHDTKTGVIEKKQSIRYKMYTHRIWFRKGVTRDNAAEVALKLMKHKVTRGYTLQRTDYGTQLLTFQTKKTLKQISELCE